MPPCWFLRPPPSGLSLRRFSITSWDLVLLLLLCVTQILSQHRLHNTSQIPCLRRCNRSILPIFHNRTLRCFAHRFMRLTPGHRWVRSISAGQVVDVVEGAGATLAEAEAGDIAAVNRSRYTQDVREPVIPLLLATPPTFPFFSRRILSNYSLWQYKTKHVAPKEITSHRPGP